MIHYRIDGVLVKRRPFHMGFSQAVNSRLKSLAGLDITEKRMPQDGVFTSQVGGGEVRFRVSTLPTEYGEKVVLRMLAADKLIVDLDQLGATPLITAQIRGVLKRPHGMFMVTGPTGSGKTSTLYALVRELLDQSLNIVTLEDPIEYRFGGVTQSQTNPATGYTFAAGLRAILRQDPDVIMMGEIRDLESARIAFKAALTGHLVLTSLHTHNTTEALVRLVDMGLERYVVASALRAVISQRLVRKVCASCRRKQPISEETRNRLRSLPRHQLRLLASAGAETYRGIGCGRCNNTGYRGRIGVFELLEVDDTISDLLRSDKAAGRQFNDELTRQGVPDLRQAGFAQVVKGITTIEEVLRVT